MVAAARIVVPARASVRWCVLRGLRLRWKGSAGATPPRGSNDQARQAVQHKPQDGLARTGAGEVDHDLGFPLDHAGRDFEQPHRTRSHAGSGRPGAVVRPRAQSFFARVAATGKEPPQRAVAKAQAAFGKFGLQFS